MDSPTSSGGKRPRPASFWLLVWMVLFLIVFNIALFAKFVVGSTTKSPGNRTPGGQTNTAPAQP